MEGGGRGGYIGIMARVAGTASSAREVKVEATYPPFHFFIFPDNSTNACT